VAGQAYLQHYDTADVTLTFQGQHVCITKIADLEVLLETLDPVAFAEDERIPYWAELWPSAVALAHYVAQRLDLAGRRVLELGCGLGLVGIVAALQGAQVLCTDYEPAALAFAHYNARRNACRKVRFRLVDWRQPTLHRRYEYILASDVVYEARNFGPLVVLLQRFLARGGSAVFSEPGRANAVPFFALLRQRGFTCQKELLPLEWDGMHQIAIYTIRYRQTRSRRSSTPGVAMQLSPHPGLAPAQVLRPATA
jgi:2-polyprenyl-3-methyl-5-hydroxy-6-metoxy-1,4-benzoquinol methylase